MIEGIKLYFKEDYKNTIIVFVVPVTLKERQEFELRAMENLLWEQFQMTTKRMTLSEIEKNSTVNETSDILVRKRLDCSISEYLLIARTTQMKTHGKEEKR